MDPLTQKLMQIAMVVFFMFGFTFWVYIAIGNR